MSDPVALTSRQTYAIGTVGVGGQFVFYIDVPAGAFLLVETNGDAGDLDLFVKRGSIPTTSSYDVKSDSPYVFETCIVSGPVADRYYILVYGFSEATNVTVRAITDTQDGTSVSVPILSYDRYGDPASIYESGGELVATPVASTSSSEDPLAAFTTHVQSGQGSCEATLQFVPPVYTGMHSYLHLLGTLDDAFVPGYATFAKGPFGGSASVSYGVPYSNVHAVFAITIDNPTSPTVGYPSSGSFGSLKAMADSSTAELQWGDNMGQLQYTMSLRFKASLLDDPIDNGDGTWSHHYLVALAYSMGAAPDYSSALCTHFWANFSSPTPLKTFALAFAPRKIYTPSSGASYADPSAVDDPASYLRAATIRPLSSDAPAPPPAPADPFWTNFVGCKEAA